MGTTKEQLAKELTATRAALAVSRSDLERSSNHRHALQDKMADAVSWSFCVMSVAVGVALVRVVWVW